jgi:hypothetical protein
MSPPYTRRQRFIDRPIQGALIVRAILFWALTLLSQILLMVFFAVLFSSPDGFYANLGALAWYLKLTAYGSLLVLPMILFDLIRLSHRWVGPIYRLRTALQALGRGDQVPPIRFREGDYWQELAGDFNVIAAELTRLRHASPGVVETIEGLEPAGQGLAVPNAVKSEK